MCMCKFLLKYRNASPTLQHLKRWEQQKKCLPGQSCEINSDLIFLRAIITGDQNSLSWLVAEWEWGISGRGRAACPSWDSKPGRQAPACLGTGLGGGDGVARTAALAVAWRRQTDGESTLPWLPCFHVEVSTRDAKYKWGEKRSQSVAYWSGVRKTERVCKSHSVDAGCQGQLGPSGSHLMGYTQVHPHSGQGKGLNRVLSPLRWTETNKIWGWGVKGEEVFSV